MLVLLYLDVDLPASQYAVYVGIMYLLWGMTYTVMDIPYWSMVPALTDNENERSQVSVIPRFFASMAWLVVGTGGLYIVKYLGNGDDVFGYSRFAIAISIVFVVTILLTVTQTKERVVAKSGTGEKTSVKGMIRVLAKNDQVLVVLGIALFFNMAYQPPTPSPSTILNTSAASRKRSTPPTPAWPASPRWAPWPCSRRSPNTSTSASCSCSPP